VAFALVLAQIRVGEIGKVCRESGGSIYCGCFIVGHTASHTSSDRENRFEICYSMDHHGLASEEEVSSLFADCDIGAVPPIGSAYDVPVVLDESLDDASDVYFEGGDHKTLVHVSGPNFRSLLKDARIARFSHRT